MEFADPIAHNLNTNAPAAEGYGTPFWNTAKPFGVNARSTSR